MLVESGNPAHSLADSQRMREALASLELLVVIDVAMTETARLADYVLPGAVAVREVGGDVLQLRVPRTTCSTCAARCSSRCPARSPSPRSTPACARRSARSPTTTSRRCGPRPRRAGPRSPTRSSRRWPPSPSSAGCAPIVLYRTLGPTLPDGAAAAAALWGAAHRCAQANPESVAARRLRRRGARARRALFDAILASPSGVVFTVDEPEDGLAAARAPTTGASTSPIARAARRARRRSPPRRRPAAIADVPVRAVGRRAPLVHRQHDLPRPVVAEEGRRRRAADQPGRRRAARRRRRRPRARHDQARGSGRAAVEVTDDDAARPRLAARTASGSTTRARTARPVVTGAAPNELTASEDRDWLAGTPWHKHVPARARARRSSRWR